MRLFVLAFLASAFLFACTPSVDKLLSRKDGTWNIDRYLVQQLVNGDTLLFVEANDAGTLVFNEDGTGTQTISILGQNDSGSFDWTYDADQEQITILDDSTTFTFDVIESDKDNQLFRQMETMMVPDLFSGDTVETISTIEMMLSRQE